MEVGRRIRNQREHLGLSQSELAASTGMSRQSIGAIESGTNLPRVDVAIAIAGALGLSVNDLFGGPNQAVDALTGMTPTDGNVRVGRVGEQLVASPVRRSSSGYESIDAVVANGHLELISKVMPGLVVAGCEPGLAIIEQSLRESGVGAMWVATSTDAALEAVDSGRAHAAAVHGNKRDLDRLARAKRLQRIHFATWRVGLSAGDGIATGWQRRALRGEMPVVQREDGATIQRVFKEFLETDSKSAPGPVAATHLEAANRGLWAGIPALTFEPAATSIGLDFHPLATHVVELWISPDFDDDPALVAALNLVSGRRFARSLEAIGGYDLEHIGTRVA